MQESGVNQRYGSSISGWTNIEFAYLLRATYKLLDPNLEAGLLP